MKIQEKQKRQDNAAMGIFRGVTNQKLWKLYEIGEGFVSFFSRTVSLRSGKAWELGTKEAEDIHVGVPRGSLARSHCPGSAPSPARCLRGSSRVPAPGTHSGHADLNFTTDLPCLWARVRPLSQPKSKKSKFHSALGQPWLGSFSGPCGQPRMQSLSATESEEGPEWPFQCKLGAEYGLEIQN